MDFPKNTRFAASPDGLVLDPTDPNKIIGCLEIKCPWRLRNFTIRNLADWNTNLDYLDKENNLLQSHPYYHQIQGEIFETILEWCDFAIWCPSGILIQRIFLDRKWQDDVLPQLQRIYKYSFIRDEDFANFDYVRNVESMEEINLADVLSLNTPERRKVFRTFIFCLALHFARWMKNSKFLRRDHRNGKNVVINLLDKAGNLFV